MQTLIGMKKCALDFFSLASVVVEFLAPLGILAKKSFKNRFCKTCGATRSQKLPIDTYCEQNLKWGTAFVEMCLFNDDDGSNQFLFISNIGR
jgi:hypothetical protein